jgi:acyl-CoA hydrolase
VRHACTAYLTYVHLGGDLRPVACRPFTPGTEGERRRWHAATVRRERRLERVERLKAALSNERG